MQKVVKLEGCGNDFVVVDLRGATSGRGDDGALTSSLSTPEAALALCDRHFGFGADGVLAILPPTAAAPDAFARMRVLNADGSEAEMCGNGIRCVAKYLYERDPEARRPELAIETGAGVLRCGVTVDGRRHVTHVTVAMGKPRLHAAEIPTAVPGVAATERIIDREIELAGRTFRYTAVSMGNPHAVVFVDGGDGKESLRELAERFGPALEHHAFFPRRTNAEFARVGAAGIELVVWERGCGITLACGTGACATAVAAVLTGRVEAGVEVAVELLGGTLFITPAADLSGVAMRGPADEVYEAEADLLALVRRHQQHRLGAGARA